MSVRNRCFLCPAICDRYNHNLNYNACPLIGWTCQCGVSLFHVRFVYVSSRINLYTNLATTLNLVTTINHSHQRCIQPTNLTYCWSYTIRYTDNLFSYSFNLTRMGDYSCGEGTGGICRGIGGSRKGMRGAPLFSLKNFFYQIFHTPRSIPFRCFMCWIFTPTFFWKSWIRF